ncbi:MAG: prolipoprotein diacylglyceryl transferase [Erysipelotrichaceae bacterium]|nr:prolipoprotein diacylglyceryl transferase [Erysipelotrichaceae bacterium]
MEFFPSSRIFVQIGPFAIAWYAVFILIGGIFGCTFAARDLKKNGYSNETIEDLFMGAFFFGIIGARLWYCVFYNFDYYFSNPINLIKIWEGGLAIQGSLVGGALFVGWYCWKHKMNYFRTGDCILPHMLLCQTFGRWGNFMNQEAYGGIVSESFYAHWPDFIADRMFIDGAYRMPTFFFESACNFIGWILIYFVYRKVSKPKRGDLVYAYLMWYGVTRFFIEGLRTDSLMFGSLRMAQLTSIAFLIVGVLGTLGVFRKLFKDAKPVILFDLDGTLLNTEPAILESYRRLFEKYAPTVEFDREKQLSVLGPPLRKMMKIYFPDQDVDALVEEYRTINKAIHPETVFPMKNAKEMLEELKNQGYKLGIVTTKVEDVTRLGLDINDMTKYFDVIVAENHVTKSKPDPEGIFKACSQLNIGHDSLIYVGDSLTDIQAGKNAGAFTIGYLFMPERKQAMMDEKPNRVIEDLIEIVEIVKEEHSWTHNMM